MTTGDPRMLLWFADNWTILLGVGQIQSLYNIIPKIVRAVRNSIYMYNNIYVMIGILKHSKNHSIASSDVGDR